MLFSFLHNIEEKISFTIPILYKVEALTYNIVNYASPQTVSFSLSAYYIDGIEDVVEDTPDDAKSAIDDGEDPTIQEE
jgi:hypothetical protein